jgi:hypothetical protein
LDADENCAGGAVLALRVREHDGLTARESGNADLRIPDEALLAIATAAERAGLTFNRKDFIRRYRGWYPDGRY